MAQIYFSRAGRAGADDVLMRTPELRVLRDKTVSVFGLGCLGAPSVLEFARGGVGRLRILDHDFVDPATMARWPFGLPAAGAPKATVLKQFIDQHYPATVVEGFVHRLGQVDLGSAPAGPSDADVVDKMLEGTSLIYDATAELGVQQFLAERANAVGVPYVGVVGSAGGWGGKVVRIIPGATPGCWLCYRHAYADGMITAPPALQEDVVQGLGCGDPTFTGTGFDMAQIALQGVRSAVSTLCAAAAGAYPEQDWDVTVIALRDAQGKLIPATYAGYKLAKHANCPHCALP